MPDPLQGLDKLGCGYNILTQEIDETNRSLFTSTDRDAATAEGRKIVLNGTNYLCPSNVTTQSNIRSDNAYSYGKSVTEYKKQYKSESSLQVGYGGYDMEARFSISEKDETSSDYTYSTLTERIERFTIAVTNQDRDHLTARAKSDIDTLPPSDLFNKYGTHILVTAHMGGRYEVDVRTSKTSKFTTEEISAGVKAKAEALGVKADAETSWDQLDSKLKKEINEHTKHHSLGGIASDSVGVWREKMNAWLELDVVGMELLRISELAEGDRKIELEEALDTLLRPGEVGQCDFGGSVVVPESTQANEWVLFTTPVFFGKERSSKQGEDALLKLSVSEPEAGPSAAQWNLPAEYLSVTGNNDGRTYEDGRLHYALIPKTLAQIVLLEGRVDGSGAVVSETVSPKKPDGTPVNAADFAKWMLVVAPREIGFDEGKSNDDNALLDYTCTVTADPKNARWTVAASCLYRYSDDGKSEHEATLPAKTRCLMVQNDDPEDKTFYSGVVEDQGTILVPYGDHNDWMLLLSPIAMNAFGSNTPKVNKTKAVISVDCSAARDGDGWKVSAKCHVRTAQKNDGDQRDLGATCHYLLVRRRGS